MENIQLLDNIEVVLDVGEAMEAEREQFEGQQRRHCVAGHFWPNYFF